jgi:uncharacterized protein (TIGR02271 family)
MQRDDEVRRDDVLDDGDDVTFDRDADTVIREDPDAHATPGGAAVAGAITGGAIGLAGGPVGAAIGAVGGAIVGAVTERVMHAGEVHAGEVHTEGEHVGTDTDYAITRSRWEDDMPGYRADFERRNSGGDYGTWNDWEPRYRWGHEMRNDPRYRGRNWDEVEPDLRRDWEARYSDTPWDRAREGMRGMWASDRTSMRDTTDRDTVQIKEEELRARKQPVQAGEVRIGKEVVEEQRSIDVPVTREEVYVERRPVERRPADNSEIGSGHEEIRMPVREERVQVEKQAVVTEEVNIGKRQVQDTEHVTDTVRKERPVIEREGDVDVEGDGDTRGGYLSGR